MISDRQNRFYWGLWGKAKRVLLNGRETFTGDEENKRRHELHVRAIGRDKSHYDLTNREFDLVIRELRQIIDPLRHLSFVTRHSVDEAERRRVYFGLRSVMRKLRLSEAYVQAIANRMFMGIDDLGLLKTEELRKLMIALKLQEKRTHAA